MAYGHGISVSLAQLARAYTMFARDGELVPLTLVKSDAAAAGRRVISPQTAQAVRAMLELAVQPGGTAPRARIMGWRVAGKTGTAHKQENGSYAPDKYISSFVGLAPASDPRIVVAVMIDEPSAGKYYGGVVAAPVFAHDHARRSAPARRAARCAARTRAAAGRGRRSPGEHLIGAGPLARLAAQGAVIERLSSDSRRCAPGVAFFAYPGAAADGRAHIAEAIARGAAGVLWEADGYAWRERVARAQRAGARPEAAGGPARARVLRTAQRGAVDLRRHWHQRQDLLQPVDRARR